MSKFYIFFLSLLIFAFITGCGDKKKHPMVDMDTIKTDGSRDDKYIFKKEIEKEEHRSKKYKKDQF
jgi:hypothetical protein